MGYLQMTLRLLIGFVIAIGSTRACPLKTVDIRSGCYCGIEVDGTNYIQCQPYTISTVPEFTRSYVHDKLNLSNNLIGNLTDKSFHQLKVKRIYLEDNPIGSIDNNTFNQPGLQHYLEELHIQSINQSVEFLCYGSWRNLRVLKLSGFNLEQHQSCFGKLPRLERLLIEHSHVNIISRHIYQLPMLHELSLTNNRLQNLHFDEPYSVHSSSIRVLNVTSNYLQSIPRDLNLRLPQLATLDLSHNLIEQLPAINPAVSLSVNLSYNRITYVRLQPSPHFLDLSANPICTIERTADEPNVLLDDLMDLHCDCRLAHLLRDNFTRYLGVRNRCATPKQFQGSYVRDLTYAQLMSVCSTELPSHCSEVNNFPQIQQLTEVIALDTTHSGERTTPGYALGTAVSGKLDEEENLSSFFRLTSFNTHYENNDLLIFWDFEITSPSRDLLAVQFQIIIEQDSEVIRRSPYLSPYLKQYIIPHLPSKTNYYVCLSFTRTSYGSDKYCRETHASTRQTFSRMLSVNRSIVLGFLTGTIVTACLLTTLAFMCHLHHKRKHALSLFHPRHSQSHYLYVNRNDDDGSYSHSLVLSHSPKYAHLKNNQHRRTYLAPVPTWYQHTLKQLPASPRSPCCFSQYHSHPMTDSATTNRMPSVSSEYSTGVDKEQMTSTSIMSNMSVEEQPTNIVQSPTKHVYEELNEHNLLL